MDKRRDTGSWAAALDEARRNKKSGGAVSLDPPTRRVTPPKDVAPANPGDGPSEWEQHLAALQIHPLFHWLDWVHVERIAAAGEVQYFEGEQCIVAEGEEGDAMFLILYGRTEVQKEGADERALAELGAGDFFGEMSLFESEPRSASVVALEPTQVFRLPYEAIRRLSQEDPRAANILFEALMRAMCARLRQMNDLVSTVSQLSDWLSGSLV